MRLIDADALIPDRDYYEGGGYDAVSCEQIDNTPTIEDLSEYSDKLWQRMNNDIKIGSTVQLLYWKDKKVHDFVITDIFFERYLTDYKTIVKARYYSKKSECWFIETFLVNDFFEAMNKALVRLLNKSKENTDNKDAENE